MTNLKARMIQVSLSQYPRVPPAYRQQRAPRLLTFLLPNITKGSTVCIALNKKNKQTNIRKGGVEGEKEEEKEVGEADE